MIDLIEMVCKTLPPPISLYLPFHPQPLKAMQSDSLNMDQGYTMEIKNTRSSGILFRDMEHMGEIKKRKYGDWAIGAKMILAHREREKAKVGKE